MNGTGLTQRVFLVLVCCLAIIFLPLSAGAQGVLEKGAKGVQKRVETGAEKTKGGAEAVGHGAKKAVTGEDSSSSSQMKETETTPSTKPSQSTMPSGTSTRAKPTTPSQSTTTEPGRRSRGSEQKAGGEKLPKTAGELPLLALIGVLSLAAAGTSRLIRR